MPQPMRTSWTSRPIQAAVVILALLVAAIVAGNLVLRDSGSDYQLKPATGAARAMADGGTRAASDPARR